MPARVALYLDFENWPGPGNGRRLSGEGHHAGGRRARTRARGESGRAASAGLGRDQHEPVPADHDRPGAGVLVEGAEAVSALLEAVPRD